MFQLIQSWQTSNHELILLVILLLWPPIVASGPSAEDTIGAVSGGHRQGPWLERMGHAQQHRQEQKEEQKDELEKPLQAARGG